MGEMRSRVSSLGTLTRWKCQNGLEALRQRPDECPPPALLDGVRMRLISEFLEKAGGRRRRPWVSQWVPDSALHGGLQPR